MAEQFILDNQIGWFHNSDVRYGYYHTYDALNLDSIPRKIHVFLPADYEIKKQKYPVVYMNDGQTAFFPNASIHNKTWDTDKSINCLYSNGLIEPVIVVAVYPVKREYEYLSTAKLYKMDGSYTVSGGLDNYSDYLANNLKPFIDKNYNTVSDSRKTLIMGSSFGGVAAFYTALKHPDAFGITAALSPSFYFELEKKCSPINLKEERFIKKISEFLNKNSIHPRIWLDWGMLEGYKYNFCPEIMLYLTGKYSYIINKTLYYYEDPYGNHDETAWSYRFNIIMTTFYGKNH